MLIAQDQDVVQTLTSNTADEPFAYGVRFGSIGRRVNEFNASARQRMFKTLAKLVIIVADQKAWPFSRRCGFPHLLRLCRLPSSSRGEWLVKQPTGNHGEVHSKQEFDAKNSYPVEARMQKEKE
jgi:hypothetical protein